MSWLHDPLTGRTVRLAPGRENRPNDFSQSGAKSRCPFCAGAEADTPDEVDRVDDANGRWLARVVPNAYPIVTRDDGAHEVVIESPRHARRLLDLTDAEALAALRLWARRLEHHRTELGAAYTLLFKNEGPAAGASLEHVHSQVVALPEAPPEADALWRRVERHGLAGATIPVCSYDGIDVVAPVASRSPGEVWVVAQEGTSLDDLAVYRALVSVVQALRVDAFNLIVQTPPLGFEIGAVAWWIELVPRRSSIAGFELATGCWINPVSPEAVASDLRGRLADPDA